MNCIVYKDSKQWLFRVKKGKCLLKLDDEEIHVFIDQEKEIILEDAYVYVFTENHGFAKYRKYEIIDELILSRRSYASIQLLGLNEDVILNLRNKTISMNNNVFVDYHLQNSFEFNDVISIFQLRIIVTKNFILINQPADVQINLCYKKEFQYNTYRYSVLDIDYGVYQGVKEMPKLSIDFRQFDKLVPFEKTSNLIVILPMLMMSLASLAVGINSSYNSYMQGKEGFDLVIPFILPCTMLVSTMFVKPLNSYIEKRRYKKKIFNRNKSLDDYFYDLEQQRCDFEKQLDDFNKNAYLLAEDIEINHIKKTYLMNQMNLDNLLIPIGLATIPSRISYNQIPSYNDAEYYNRYLAFKDRHISMDNKVFHLKFSEISSIVIKDAILFEWILLQLRFCVDDKKVEIYLFTSDEWLNNKKEYLFLNLIVITSSDSELSSKDNKSKIALVTNEKIYEQTRLEFVSTIYLNTSTKIYDCSIVMENDGYIYNNSIVFHNKLNWEVITIFKNNLIKYFGRMLRLTHNNYKLFDLYKFEITKSYINSNWITNKPYDYLKAPIGMSNGEIFEIDLNEKVHGPHILIGSTTGGGKSEAIITILYSLAINYSPRYFQFAIIDFKGGGLADAFKLDKQTLPHCVGSLTNLDSSEMERLLVSFEIESKRRQLLFSKMVAVSKQSPMNIGKYQKLVDEGIDLPQLAHLMYVIDEFAELKMSEPNFVNELIRVARIGRSLGIYLLLSTQKPASVVDGQIWANCSTRICLKVQDRQDSMEMIESDRGAFLKQPGHFYLFNNQKVIEGQMALTSSDYSYADKTNIKLLTNHLQDLQNRDYGGESQITTLLNIMATENENIHKLWQQSLKNEEYQWKIIHDFQIGIIDDISNNSQYPFIYEYRKNMIVFSMNRQEKQNFMEIIIEKIIAGFNNQYELIIVDFEKMTISLYENNEFIQIVDNRYMLESLIKTLVNDIKIQRELIIIVTHYPTFLEVVEELHYLVEQILHIGTRKKCYFIFLTNTSNSIKYSLLHYFNIRVALSIENVNEYIAIFEKPMKTWIVEKGFGYVMEKEVKLFKYIQKTNQNAYVNMRCKFERIKLLSEKVILKRSSKIILGIDLDTMQEIELVDKKILFVVAKYSSSYHKFINDTFKEYRNVISKKDLNLSKITIDYEEFKLDVSEDIIDYLNDRSVIVTCCQDDWYSSWMRTVYKGTNIIWIGEGFHEQTIVRNERWLKLRKNEAFYISSKDNHKIRCIDKYEE